MTAAFVALENVRKSYSVKRGLLGASRLLHAVGGVSFQVPEGSSFGLVGESGSGKTTIARMILAAERPTSGTVMVAGRRVGDLGRAERLTLRREIQPVLQDPYSSLNPSIRVERTIDEPLRIHRLHDSRAALRSKVEALVDRVGLSQEVLARFPHELSGGQRQRVAIARALSIEPRGLVLDEPVSALDVSVQAQILNLLKDLQKQKALTYILISHDLAVVAYMSDSIGVLYLGQLMEVGSRIDIVESARHPYTRALLEAARSDAVRREDGKVGVLQGEIPSPLSPTTGCPFHTRCPMADDRCRSEKPMLREVSTSQRVACHFA